MSEQAGRQEAGAGGRRQEAAAGAEPGAGWRHTPLAVAFAGCFGGDKCQRN